MADRKLDLARMNRDQLEAAMNLHKLAIPGNATDDDLRQMLDETGNFKWNWPIANLISGVAVIIAAGFVFAPWAVAVVLCGAVLLGADVYRSWKRSYQYHNRNGFFLKEAWGEILGVVLILLGLILNAPIVIVVSGAICIFDGIVEYYS